MKLSREILLMSVALATLAAADVNRGKELYQQGRYAEAASELRDVVRNEAENAEALRYLGLALLEQDNAAEASGYLTKADELSSSGETKAALARLYVKQKKIDQAEAALQDASGEGIEYTRGMVHLERKRYEEAAQAFESHLEKSPRDAYAHYYAGLAYNGMKRPDKMLSHFEMFVKLKPDAPEAKKVRAVLKTGR